MDKPHKEPTLESSADNAMSVPRVETFRSSEYKSAARNLAWSEFKGLSRSTVNAVLAESNYCYLDARQTLVDLSQKSWRFTLSSILLYRRRPVSNTEAETHPLVIWKSTGQGSIVPAIKSTGHPELDRDLFQSLIMPLTRATRKKREEEDQKLAIAMNQEEAEAENAMHECCCCFTDGPFEDFTSCSSDGHLICIHCVQQAIQEAMYGQGWTQSINTLTGTLRCPAVPTATGADSCDGCIPSDQMQRAVLSMKKGVEILHKFEQRLADRCLAATGLPVVRCPFCDYAEIDDPCLKPGDQQLRFNRDNIPTLICLLFVIVFSCPVVLISVLLALTALLISSKRSFSIPAVTELRAALTRHRRRQRGLRFRCLNPLCGRASCLSCAKAWDDLHVCNESSLVSLRTQVEQAMSMAIKRVCPSCGASFVKETGCNKMTCQCGYKMCYVCRRDIGGKAGDQAGYQHFCTHFHPLGDGSSCKQCDKCNLWQKEDTEAVLKRAREGVERRWRETEQRELSRAELAFLETGVAQQRRYQGLADAIIYGRWPSLPEVCDMIVAYLIY